MRGIELNSTVDSNPEFDLPEVISGIFRLCTQSLSMFLYIVLILVNYFLSYYSSVIVILWGCCSVNRNAFHEGK